MAAHHLAAGIPRRTQIAMAAPQFVPFPKSDTDVPVFFALLTWLPIAIRALLQHYGIHVHCLVAIPLLDSWRGHTALRGIQ